jgi:excinuclease ABC subunit B
MGEIDVLVGVNLLREGLDLPEVSKVIVFDADLEGFLRSERSLIQIIGRAARNMSGEVIFYADKVTPAMRSAINETDRRRMIQERYNLENNITPKPLEKTITSIIERSEKDKKMKYKKVFSNIDEEIEYMEKYMKELAENLKFEEALIVREELLKLKKEKNFYNDEFGI